MGLDYGDKRIGIALSDESRIIASPFETYSCKDEQTDLRYLTALAKKNEVVLFVLGLPLNMDGTEGERAKKTRGFAEKLENLSGLLTDFEDERLSSHTAEDMLIEAGVRREDRKKLIDKVAASIILQSYMDKC